MRSNKIFFLLGLFLLTAFLLWFTPSESSPEHLEELIRKESLRLRDQEMQDSTKRYVRAMPHPTTYVCEAVQTRLILRY